MNHESQQQFDPENAPAFERLRDRRRAKRRRMLRVALTLLVCAALLGGAVYYAHRQIVKPYLDTPVTSGETDTPSEPEAAVPRSRCRSLNRNRCPNRNRNREPEPEQPGLALAQATEQTKTARSGAVFVFRRAGRRAERDRCWPEKDHGRKDLPRIHDEGHDAAGGGGESAGSRRDVHHDAGHHRSAVSVRARRWRAM
ncbi:MAG: hypothetical protein ACLU3I_10980 [Acutalibacteraceae bacterium]